MVVKKSAPDGVELGEGTLIRSTDAAIFVRLKTGEQYWVPMSCVHADSELYGRDEAGDMQAVGETGSVVVKRWWAIEKGLVDDHNTRSF